MINLNNEEIRVLLMALDCLIYEEEDTINHKILITKLKDLLD
jgi:hypothetical protein